MNAVPSALSLACEMCDQQTNPEKSVFLLLLVKCVGLQREFSEDYYVVLNIEYSDKGLLATATQLGQGVVKQNGFLEILDRSTFYSSVLGFNSAFGFILAFVFIIQKMRPPLFLFAPFQKGLKNVFDEAILAALEPPEPKKSRRCVLL